MNDVERELSEYRADELVDELKRRLVIKDSLLAHQERENQRLTTVLSAGVPAVAFGSDPVVPPGAYRHFKGTTYEVLGFAVHSETKERLVIYRKRGDPGAPVWARPSSMWNEVTVRGEQRFVRQEN